MSIEANQINPNQIVLSIPMLLKDRNTILSAVAENYATDYLFAGKIFQDTIANEYCLIDIYNFTEEERLNSVDFYLSDRTDVFPEKMKKEIENCTQIVCLTCNELSYSACIRMAEYAKVFLCIGGLAVFVESTGITHSKDKWLADCDSEDVFDIYSLFVTLIEGDRYYYSCGMQNFGKADVSLDFTEDIGLANYFMNVFNYYRLTEPVILKEGQTFQPDMECPIYQIKWREYDSSYEQDSLLYNHFGRWHLSRVESKELDISYQVN